MKDNSLDELALMSHVEIFPSDLLYFSMSFFDMLGYLVMAPLLDYFGRVRTLTGAYSITGGSIIISSIITYFFPDVAFLGTVCRVLGEL